MGFGLEMCLVYVKVGRDLLQLTTYSDLVMTNLATLLLLLLVCLLLTVIYSVAGCYCVVYSAWNIFDFYWCFVSLRGNFMRGLAASCQQKILCMQVWWHVLLVLFGCSRNFSVLIAFLETEVFESVLLHAGFHKPPRKIITDLAPRSCFALSSYPHDVFCRRWCSRPTLANNSQHYDDHSHNNVLILLRKHRRLILHHYYEITTHHS
jgi:hypothetical protein